LELNCEDNMTVSTSARVQTFAGGQSVLTFNFKTLYAHPEYIKVNVNPVGGGTVVPLVYNVGYSVSVNSDGVGGTVTVSPTYSTAYTYVVYRLTTALQGSAYSDFNQFPASTLENNLDQLTMIAQEQVEDNSRTVQIPIGSSPSSATLPVGAANTVLGWDGTGTSLQNIDPATLDFISVSSSKNLGTSDGVVPTQNAVKNYVGTYYPVTGYGAVGNGSTDDTVAIKAAISAAVSAGGGKVYFPPGTYKITTTLQVGTQSVHLLGSGCENTIISLVTTAATTAILFRNSTPTATIGYCSIRDISLRSSDTTYVKKAVVLSDVEEFLMENVNIGFGGSKWRDSTHASVGLQVMGRQTISVRGCNIDADNPLQISQNPNRATEGLIDIDHSHFEDLYLLSEYGPCVTIDTGINLTNVTFDGYQAWVGGTYGLYWIDTTTIGISSHLTIKGVRTEQYTSATAYSIYISHNYRLQNFRLMDSLLDLYRKGIYLRKVQGVTLDSVFYGSLSLEALNMVANAGDWLDIRDCLFGAGSTATLTGYVKQLSFKKAASSSPAAESSYYVYQSSNATDNLSAGVQLDGTSFNTSSVTGGTTSAGAGKQYITFNINGANYKLLHDGTI
jgi:hypothetical protein